MKRSRARQARSSSGLLEAQREDGQSNWRPRCRAELVIDWCSGREQHWLHERRRLRQSEQSCRQNVLGATGVEMLRLDIISHKLGVAGSDCTKLRSQGSRRCPRRRASIQTNFICWRPFQRLSPPLSCCIQRVVSCRGRSRGYRRIVCNVRAAETLPRHRTRSRRWASRRPSVSSSGGPKVACQTTARLIPFVRSAMRQDLFDAEGFASLYDFVYLPADIATGAPCLRARCRAGLRWCAGIGVHVSACALSTTDRQGATR